MSLRSRSSCLLKRFALFVLWSAVLMLSAQVAFAQITYTSDTNLADFTSKVSSYATLSNFSACTDNTCPTTPSFTPTSEELAAYAYRVYNGTLAGSGLPANNWIEATFPEPASSIIVFPSMDHYGSAYDGYQYTIAGSNDSVNWTVLFDATGVSACTINTCVAGANGEPFTLGTYIGTPPTSVNNVLMPYPSPGLPAGCAAGVNQTHCTVGYIATFNFSTAYQYYAFGASYVAVHAGNADQELSAVGAIVPSRTGTFPPTSGALLNITSSDKTINLNIYDSQIHTGNVQVVPVGSGMSNCNSNDALYPTDAYVLQGGSPTGCDPGETFETSQGTGTASIGGFTINTSYGPTPGCTSENVSPQVCAGPNTGFLTVTNSTGASFMGTITLTGTEGASSTESPTPTCVAGGSLTSTFSGTLANGTSTTLALATDTSSCGGFNAPLQAGLTAGSTTTYAFGGEQYQITPFNSASGDTLSVLPVPVPAGPQTGGTYGNVNDETGEAITFPSSQSFNSGTNFPGQNCIAYSDFSAAGNPVCVELQFTCTSSASDCETFLYQGEVFFTKDTNSLGPVGGAAFLGQHLVNCATPSFNPNLDVFLAYQPTFPDPIKSSGGGTSCYVTTYNPTAAAVQVGQTQTEVAFVGFQSPVANGVLNKAKAGSTVPLKWQTFDPVTGNAVTNLTLCSNTAGTGCTAPWVFLGYSQVACQSSSGSTSTVLDDSGNSGLQNLGNGSYQFNWKTSKGFAGMCATPVLEFSSGFISFNVATFQFF